MFLSSGVQLFLLLISPYQSIPPVFFRLFWLTRQHLYIASILAPDALLLQHLLHGSHRFFLGKGGFLDGLARTRLREDILERAGGFAEYLYR
jgi:hypothetical protein